MTCRDFIIAHFISPVQRLERQIERQILQIDDQTCTDSIRPRKVCTRDLLFAFAFFSRNERKNPRVSSGSFARGLKRGEEFHERVCATFERPVFFVPARDHGPLFFYPSSSLSLLSISFSFCCPFSISLAPLDQNNVHPRVCGPDN